MTQVLSYGRGIPPRGRIDADDWRLTRPRVIAWVVAVAALLAAHVWLYQSIEIDRNLTALLFLAHLFVVTCGALRWCPRAINFRWTRGHTYVGLALAAGYGAVILLTLPTLRAEGLSELYLLPAVLFLWWWQGLDTGTGFVLGYATIVLMWWGPAWTGGDLNEPNLLPMVVFVMLYASLFGRPWLLGFIFIYLFSVRFGADYTGTLPTFLVLSLLYTTLPTFTRMYRTRVNRLLPVNYMFGLILLGAVLLPVAYLSTDSSPQDLKHAITQPAVWSALKLSLMTSVVAMGIVTLFGVPLAYGISRASFPGKGLIITAIDLPIVIPPPVAGIALLLFLGARSPLGRQLTELVGAVVGPGSALELTQNTPEAVSILLIVLAQIFVSSPFLIRSSLVAFQGVDPHYEQVARTLGASALASFRRVTLPLAMRGIVAGMILCWLRAMAEYGSLRVLASFPKTAPILILERFDERGGLSEAQPIAVLMVVIALLVFLAMWAIRVVLSLLFGSGRPAEA